MRNKIVPIAFTRKVDGRDVQQKDLIAEAGIKNEAACGENESNNYQNDVGLTNDDDSVQLSQQDVDTCSDWDIGTREKQEN